MTAYHEAKKLYKNSRYEQALFFINISIEQYPDCNNSYHLKGLILKSLKRYALALDALQESININPTLPMPHLFKGIVLELMQQPKAALASYNNALQIQPDYSLALQKKENLEQSLNPKDYYDDYTTTDTIWHSSSEQQSLGEDNSTFPIILSTK